MPEDATKLIGLEKGTFDLVYPETVTADIDAQVRKMGAVMDRRGPGGQDRFYINMTKPPFDDIRVRRAFMHAIDRKAIKETLYPGALGRSPRPVPRGYFGHTPVELPEYNPELARKLLAEAGHPNGFTVKNYFMSKSFVFPKVMTLAQEQLRKVGIVVEVQIVEHATYHENIRKNLNPFVLFGGTRLPDADPWLTLFFHSGEIPDPATGNKGTNFAHYRGIDDLLAPGPAGAGREEARGDLPRGAAPPDARRGRPAAQRGAGRVGPQPQAREHAVRSGVRRGLDPLQLQLPGAAQAPELTGAATRPRRGHVEPMRSYARSIALYEEARRHLAGGVSSNFRRERARCRCSSTAARARTSSTSTATTTWTTSWAWGPAILGHAPPDRSSDGGARSRLGRGQLFAGQTRAEVELAERFRRWSPCAERVRFGSSGHRDGPGRDPARAGGDRPPGHRQVRGPLPRLARPGPRQRRSPPLEVAGPARRARRRTCPSARPGRRDSVENVVVLPWNDADGARAPSPGGPDRERIAA